MPAYKLIELGDGTLVEVEDRRPAAEQIADHGIAFLEGTSFASKLKPLLLNIARPLTEVWGELNRDLAIEKAEIELGLGFAGEGNLFVTKATGSANLKVKLILSPKAPQPPEPPAGAD